MGQYKERRMEPCACVIFTRRTGKIVKCLDTLSGYAVLSAYAMQNVSPAQDALVFFKNDGKVIRYFEGRKNNIPNMYEDELGYADDYCPGLLESVNNA
jgi:hypothetical protein